MSTTTEPRLLTVGEVAERLNCHVNTVRAYIHSGRLPARRVGRPYLVPQAAVDRLAAVETVPGVEAVS